MKNELLIGGIYNMGDNDNSTGIRVVVEQNDEFVLLYIPQATIANPNNNHDQILEKLSKEIERNEAKMPFTVKVSSKVVNKPGYISGYLGKIPEEILAVFKENKYRRVY